MKQRTVTGFGERLAEIRKRRGLTQRELGEAVGVSKRTITYYEQADAQPPGALLPHLARALQVSADELLGLRPTKVHPSRDTARLFKRLQKVAELPPPDRRAVLKMVDALVESRRRPKST